MIISSSAYSLFIGGMSSMPCSCSIRAPQQPWGTDLLSAFIHLLSSFHIYTPQHADLMLLYNVCIPAYHQLGLLLQLIWLFRNFAMGYCISAMNINTISIYCLWYQFVNCFSVFPPWHIEKNVFIIIKIISLWLIYKGHQLNCYNENWKWC